ncbi:MAG: glycosyltransferase family 39 protein [Candidatus Altiarchaeota archaeon]
MIWPGKRVILLEFSVLAVISAFVMFSGLDRGSLADWDEALYGEISKETLLTGDWVTPHFKGFPYLAAKPPFFFHLVSLTYGIFGISTFTSRFWTAIFGFGTVLVVFLLGLEMFNDKIAFMASMILVSCPHFLEESRKLMLDVPLTFFIASSFYFLVSSRRNGSLRPLSGLMIGLATMIKAPLGVLALAVMCVYMGRIKGFNRSTLKEYLTVFLAFAIVVFPWHLVQLAVNTDLFLGRYIYHYTVERMVIPIEGHDHGNIYLLNVLWHGLGNWGVFCVAGVGYVLLCGRWRQPETLLTVAWGAVFLAVFLAARTKIPWLLIPIYPPLAILAAILLERLVFKELWVGILVFAAVFFLSFEVPGPFNCNGPLYELNQVSGGNVRVHNSVSTSPANVFYLGIERFPKDDLTEEDALYVSTSSAYSNLAGYDVHYSGGGYVLFSKKDKGFPDGESEGMNLPASECYTYWPNRLGRS